MLSAVLLRGERIMSTNAVAIPQQALDALGFFERYLSLWVALCMGAGVLLGKAGPALVQGLPAPELGRGSQINVLLNAFRNVIWEPRLRFEIDLTACTSQDISLPFCF
jgi:ACR3 family arsenite transporter